MRDSDFNTAGGHIEGAVNITSDNFDSDAQSAFRADDGSRAARPGGVLTARVPAATARQSTRSSRG